MPRTARILFPSRPREREDFRNAIYGRIKVLRRVIRSPTSLLLPLLLLLPFPLSLLPPFTHLSPQLPLTLPHPYIRRDNEDTFVGIPRTRNSCYVPDTAGRPVNAIMPMLSITYPRQQLLRREPGQVTARSLFFRLASDRIHPCTRGKRSRDNGNSTLEKKKVRGVRCVCFLFFHVFGNI